MALVALLLLGAVPRSATGAECGTRGTAPGHDAGAALGGAAALKPQTLCPVMKLPVNPDLYVDFLGKRISLCCPGCLPEVRQNPEKAIASLAEMGQAPVPVPGAQGDPAGVDGVRTLGILLFPGFETLDTAGPIEMWGNLKSRVRVVTVAAARGEVASTQGVKTVADHGFADCPPLDLFLVPGGRGSSEAAKDGATLDFIRRRAGDAEITMSVCSGATLLAAAGLLDGRRATTNKAMWEPYTSRFPKVEWVRKARWVDDGNIVTSSGVSAGMDMSLHVIARLFGPRAAEALANLSEYEWHRDADRDPFAGARPMPAMPGMEGKKGP